MAGPKYASSGSNDDPTKCDDERVYCLGDIHGRSDLLEEKLRLVADDLRSRPAKNAVLICLGDYIDRGPDSRGVISRLTGVNLPIPLIALRGNHEQMLLEFLDRPEMGRQWRQVGGTETLLSYGIPAASLRWIDGAHHIRDALVTAMPAAHAEFLKQTHASAVWGPYYFCHAGVRPGVALDAQIDHDLLWIREPFLSHKGDFGKIIVHGHTPRMTPEVWRNRINLDTGAYATGVLTCAVLQKDAIRFL